MAILASVSAAPSWKRRGSLGSSDPIATARFVAVNVRRIFLQGRRLALAQCRRGAAGRASRGVRGASHRAVPPPDRAAPGVRSQQAYDMPRVNWSAFVDVTDTQLPWASSPNETIC